MSFKLLVFDLDDTLLADDLTISYANKAAIREAKKKGIHVVLCSGRPMDSMMPYAEELDIHSDDDYIVSYNGAIINMFDGTRVLYKPVEGKALNTLIDIGRSLDIDVQLYTDELTVEKHTDRTKHYEGLTGLHAVVVEDLKVFDSSVKVLYNHSNRDELEQLRIDLNEKFPDQFNIFYSKPYYLEVLNKSVSKGLAVKYLADILGIEREEVLAVGDGYNDVSMIEYAGTGVAMRNAPEGVKEIADHITERTNNESVVVEIMEKYIID